MTPHDRQERGRRAWWRADDGNASAFVLVFLTAILALAGLALDGGLALAAKVKANGQAESAARAGAQAIDLAAYRTTGALHLLPSQAATTARAYLAAEHATGHVTVAGDTVTVTVTTTQPTQLLGLVGISSLAIETEASAHLQRDPTTTRGPNDGVDEFIP